MNAPAPLFIDSYEERSVTIKTSKVVVARCDGPMRLSNVTVWFPNAIEKLDTEEAKSKAVIIDPVNTLFEDVTEPPELHNNIVMRLNVFANDENNSYSSLLTQPIIVDSQLKAMESNTFAAYVNPEFVIESGTILVVQREYFHIGKYDFPNLVSLKFN